MPRYECEEERRLFSRISLIVGLGAFVLLIAVILLSALFDSSNAEKAARTGNYTIAGAGDEGPRQVWEGQE
ncbi:MAG: hypothetical protein WC291_07255 [Thermodesulfovibrionales bacterium]|jgi:hypothetical protein